MQKVLYFSANHIVREFEFLWEAWKKRISGPKTGKRSEKGKDLKKEEKGRRERERGGREKEKTGLWCL